MRYLLIMEVSQKQAYIFKSNKLQDNIMRSAEIAGINNQDYLSRIISDKEIFNGDNFVMAGGGQTILEFESEEKAKEFSKRISKKLHEVFPRMEIFIKIMKYNEDEKPATNIRKLIENLERKKSVRRLSFHKGSFGVEKIDKNTTKPISKEVSDFEDHRDFMFREHNKVDNTILPKEYRKTLEFKDLGGSIGEMNYIAVVHIDGNGMGKRVAEFYDSLKDENWEDFKLYVNAFSDDIDSDFKKAMKEMNEVVAKAIKDGKLDALNLKDKNFPVRRIISSGDDICFVSDGRIGIEASVAFIKALTKLVNATDEKTYSACAGVAIVHSKYPFFRAYELAEQLCSNAKKFGAKLSKEDNGACVSSIDWHMEQGELRDDLSEIRREYITDDGKSMILRPYIVDAPKKILENEKIRRYENFIKVMHNIKGEKDDYVRGKLKEMRPYLKAGKKESEYYIEKHRISDIVLNTYQGIYTDLTDSISKIGKNEKLERNMFINIDGKDYSTFFDAVEVMDCFLELEGGNKDD